MKSPLSTRCTLRCALPLALLLTAPTHADITGRAVPVIRWGQSPASVGLADCTMEDFEDTTLAPGLSITWTAASGTVGPVTTLPRTFDPVTEDPFGNAFDTGVWNGTHALISALGNQSYNYSVAQNWGDVELSFSTPQRVVGFSLQQADANITVVINGVSHGTLSSIVGSSAVSGGRAGYFVITATGSDTISTLRLDNSAGDGWTIDSLLFSPNAAPVIGVTGISPTEWPRPDAQLGISPAVTENFEDAALATGLQVSWEAPAGLTPPTSTLPNLFAPVTDDPFGNAFDAGPWDDTHAAINTRDNLSHPYTGTGEWGDIAFHFNPPRRAVGFSMQQTEGPTRLLINGRDVGDIVQLAGFTASGGRLGYVRVEAPCGGALISELRLNNQRTNAGGDGTAIDHLMAGTPISFATQDAAMCGVTPAQFSITPQGPGPFTYQWQIEATPGAWTTLGNDPGPLPGGGTAFAAPINSPSVIIGVQGRAGPFNVRAVVSDACDTVQGEPSRLFINPADLGSTGGIPGADGVYDNNDFVVFIDFFFNHDTRADLGRTGGLFGHDDAWDNNDFVVFIDRFFSGC